VIFDLLRRVHLSKSPHRAANEPKETETIMKKTAAIIALVLATFAGVGVVGAPSASAAPGITIAD
jgi:hypothetical protein